MTKDINFLEIKKLEKRKTKKGLKLVKITAIFSLIVVILLSVLVYYLNRRIYPQSLKSERDSLLRSLSILHEKEAKLAIVANRTGNISEIIDKRVDYSEIVSKFFDKIPQQMKVDSLKIDKKTIILSISSNSLLPINEFIEGLMTLGKDKEISVLLLDSLSANEASGTYSVSLTANL